MLTIIPLCCNAYDLLFFSTTFLQLGLVFSSDISTSVSGKHKVTVLMSSENGRDINITISGSITVLMFSENGQDISAAISIRIRLILVNVLLF